GPSFGASRFTHLLRPVRLLALLYGSDRCARPPRAFTSRLPTDRSPSPLLGITTTATGLLCWRDLHPLEWQLASLHQITRAKQASKKHFAVRRVSGSGDLWVTEYILTYDGKASYTVSIMEFSGGKVARETQYFA